MIPNLDTFLVALYSTVDDLYQKHDAPQEPKRRGKNPDLSDSEVLTLVISPQWHGTSLRAFIRYAADPSALLRTGEAISPGCSARAHATVAAATSPGCSPTWLPGWPRT